MFSNVLLGGAICFCAAVGYTLCLVMYNLFFHPLRSYPGPRSWAATRIPYFRSCVRGNFARDVTRLHGQYGDVIRIQPDHLSYTNPLAWKDIYGHRQGHDEFPKYELQLSKQVNGVASIIGANRENHARYRRLLSHAFSDKGLREQEPLIKHYVDLLIRRLRENANKGPQNMVSWYNWTTFDLLGELAFGASFQCLEKSEEHPWIAFIFGNIKSIPLIEAFRRYGIFPLVQLILPKKILEARQRNYEFARDRINSRMKLGTDRDDFLDKVLKHEYPKGMSSEELTSTGSTLVLAGSETTATLLSGATYYLLRNREVLAKLATEIRGAFSKDQEIDIVNVGQLKYLDAVLEESLRKYPPVPVGISRTVPYPGDTVNGKWLPGGTLVLVPHLATSGSPELFHQADKFIPERWLPDRAEIYANDDRASFQPFSLGPRNCIGKNLAYVEMRLILAKVLYNFDLELDEKRVGDWTDQKVFVLWEKKPLWINLKPVQS